MDATVVQKNFRSLKDVYDTKSLRTRLLEMLFGVSAGQFRISTPAPREPQLD